MKKCIATFSRFLIAIWWTLNIITYTWTCYLRATTTGFVYFSGNRCILFQKYLNRCKICLYYSNISYSNLTWLTVFFLITNISHRSIFNFSIYIFFYNWNWSLKIYPIFIKRFFNILIVKAEYNICRYINTKNVII